jgi:hypothetical protein
MLSYLKAKLALIESNHGRTGHKFDNYPRDAYHEIAERMDIKDWRDNMLVLNCSDAEKPFYTKKRYYLLTTLLGVNFLHRQQFLANSHLVNFKIAKRIEKVDKKPAKD